MSPDIIATIVMLAVGVFIGVQFEKAMAKQRRAEWRQKNKSRWKKKGEAAADSWTPKADPVPQKAPHPADQLKTVMKADFKAQPLLNKSEARLFKMIDQWVIELQPGWQVMGQVSLGEILRCDDREAYWCINAKRVDLLIVDEKCNPKHAIEYQGGAHFKGAHHTAARDAIKREALRRAGIDYIEVNAGDTPAELRRIIEKLLRKGN